jgi:hypothetical protein
MKRILPALIVAVACAGLSAAQNGTSVAFQADKLVNHWHEIVETTFEDHRAFTTDEWEDQVYEILDSFMAGGAVRAIQDKATEQQLQKADEAIRKLALGMIEAGERLPDGTTHITPESIPPAVKKVCPQYPFCG